MGAVAASISYGRDVSDGDDDGLPSRPVKKGAASADHDYRALVPAWPEPVDDGSASSGCKVKFFRQRIARLVSSQCPLEPK